MKDKPLAMITTLNFGRWLLLGLPAVVFWVIGGQGALSLLGGLVNGSVTPGTGSSASSLGVMWGAIVLCALVGIAVGMSSLFRPISNRMLALCAFTGFASLFFSVLT